MKGLKDFSYQHVLVLGLAKSGTAAADLLLDSGVKVRINDMNADLTHPNVKGLIHKGAETVLGSHPLSVLDDIDLIVKNPGIPYTNPVLKEAENRNIQVITEIELAGKVTDGNNMIAVTGSNGKTTTTTLVYEMLEKSNQPVKLAGNIGIVAADVARELKKDETLLLELSSFQLMGIQEFKPHIAALLNLFEAHLDYHGSLEAYIDAKANIFRNQNSDDYLVYNADDERVVSIIDDACGRLVPFSLKKKNTDGAWISDESVFFKNEVIINKTDIQIVGDHNLENILAAISIAMLGGATAEGIHMALSAFTGVEHRLQFVRKLHGREFYNDSKATNMLATIKALQAFNQPTILLAGGLDRGDHYDALIPYLNNVKAMVLFGETKDKLKSTAEKVHIPIKEAENVTDAASIAYNMSKHGDIILLSPACASWDQYRTFEERGNMFVQTVHILQ